MTCPCCNNIVDCFGCFIEKKTLSVTISTASGAPFKDTVTSLGGAPVISLLPSADSLVYLSPPQLFGNSLCGPACANLETQICPSSYPHQETSAYQPKWYSSARECVSSFVRYTTYQTGELLPVYALNCNSFEVFAYTLTARQALQQNLVGGTCPYFDVPNCDVTANVGFVSNFRATFQLGFVSCNPLLMIGNIASGRYGPSGFAGLFTQDFTVTVTE